MTPHWTDGFSTRLKNILATQLNEDINKLKKEKVVLLIISGEILKAHGAGKKSIKELCDYFNLDVPTQLNYANNPEIIYLVQQLDTVDLLARSAKYSPIGYTLDRDVALRITQQASDAARKHRTVFSMDNTPKYTYLGIRLIDKI